MDIRRVRGFLDACQEVKKIQEYFPELPKGLTQRHIKVIVAIEEGRAQKGKVKISDVSEAMGGTKPSITRLIQDLVKAGAVEKEPDEKDRRIFWLKLTSLGERYYESYCQEYHAWLLEQFQEVSEEGIDQTIATIHQIYEILQNVSKVGCREEKTYE